MEAPRVIGEIVIVALTAMSSFLLARYTLSRTDVSEKARDLATEGRDKAKELNQANVLLLARVADLETSLAVVKATVLPISTAFQAILVKELTHYHTPELDSLLSRIGPPSLLSHDEEVRLAVLLAERTTDMGDLISNSERDAAKIFPIVMKRARAEEVLFAMSEPAAILKIVSVGPLKEHP